MIEDPGDMSRLNCGMIAERDGRSENSEGVALDECVECWEMER